MTPEMYYENKRNLLPYAKERACIRKSIDEVNLEGVKSIHIIGICGTAMASLAGLLVQKGFTVTGSDSACYPPMSDVLKDIHITALPFDVKNVEQKDLIIVGNMCGPTNIEAVYCRDNNIPQFSIGEIIRKFFIEDKKSIVVAGTHGKTTTTSIGISAFKYLGLEPSYLVGGVLKENNTSAQYNSNSDFFIIEGDEYDTAYFDKQPKFLHYKPYITIITSLELDHIDIYKDYKDYEQAFRFLIEATNKDGVVVACIDDDRVKDLIESVRKENVDRHIITYGLSTDADIHIVDITTNSEGQKVSIVQGHEKDSFTIHMHGAYNALNATAIYAVTKTLNLNLDTVKKSFALFQGAKRRQEIVGIKNNVIIIDDFAHHPTAVSKTLKGIQERFPNHSIKAIFEPRSNSSRAKIFEYEYINAFESASAVYISTPPMKKEGFNPNEFIDITHVAEQITAKGIPCKSFANADEIVVYIKPEIHSGDILVVMSNGDFDGIHQKLLNTI